MPTVWQLLETTPGPAAVPAVWKAGLGTAFDAFREAFLRQLPTPAKSYPCPRECGCAHEIVRHKGGPIVAVCRCEPSHCDDISLTDADVAILELNWPKLGRAIAQAFGLTRREAETGVPGAIQIAAYGDEAVPVILTIQHDRDDFRQAVTALAAQLRGRFILFAATADFMDAPSRQILANLNAGFLTLDATIKLMPTGTIMPTASPAHLLARALTPAAAHATPAGPPPTPPPTLEEEAVLDLCRRSSNQAFLYWQSFEADLAHCPPLGRENEKKFRAMRDTFREWFEDLGHWRDLRPKAKDLDPDDHNAHAKHQKQIEDFIAVRRAKMHPPIEYDEVRKAHRVQYEGTEHEDVEYNWEFFRDGVSQLILRTAGGNVLPPHRDPLKRQYFKNTPPAGYAILESGDKLAGAVFFPNGDSYGFDPCFGDENRFYPDDLFQAGDYELRKVAKRAATLEAVHAVAQEIKTIVQTEKRPATPTPTLGRTSPPRPRYLLRQGVGHWLFTVAGLDGHIADEKGLRYVEYLFKNPPEEPIHATDLQAQVCEMDTNAEGVTEIVDPDSAERFTLSRTARIQERNLSIDDRDAKRRIWRIRQTWQRIIDDETATNMEREEARAEKTKIDEALASTAFRDKSNAAKTYDRIRQAITRLLKHLDAKKTKDGEKDPTYEAFAEHIRQHLIGPSRRYSGMRTSRTRTGTAQTFMYERPDGVVWSD